MFKFVIKNYEINGFMLKFDSKKIDCFSAQT